MSKLFEENKYIFNNKEETTIKKIEIQKYFFFLILIFKK